MITVGEREHRLAPGRGCSPARRPARAALVEQGVGRVLLVVSPGGFEVSSAASRPRRSAENLDAAMHAAASEEFGITWL